MTSNSSKNIVLIGLMGSGKTTIGKLISTKLNMNFVDTDELIEIKAQMSINQIFSHYGEKYFRDLEMTTIQKVSDGTNQVISTGGGCVENPINIDNIKKTSVIIYLKASAKELYSRIKDDTSRPLLKSNNLLETLEKLLDKREKFYMQADYKLETMNKSIDAIVDEILLKLNLFLV